MPKLVFCQEDNLSKIQGAMKSNGLLGNSSVIVMDLEEEHEDYSQNIFSFQKLLEKAAELQDIPILRLLTPPPSKNY